MSQFGRGQPGLSKRGKTRGFSPKILRTLGVWQDARSSLPLGVVLADDPRARLVDALVAGDAAGIEAGSSHFLLKLSYHDLPISAAEVAYHNYLMGVIVDQNPLFEVKSNLETGHGRPDLMLLPRQPGLPGVVIELKVLPPKGQKPPTPARIRGALAAALSQIETLAYAAELSARGAAPIHEVAIVFSGKRAWAKVHTAKA